MADRPDTKTGIALASKTAGGVYLAPRGYDKGGPRVRGAARSENTLKVYDSDVRDFSTYCRVELGGAPLPAPRVGL